MLGDSTNGFFLVISFDDFFVDTFLGQIFPLAASLDQQFKLIALVKTLHLTWWVIQIVPKPGLVAVGVKDQRPLFEFRFQTIRIEFCLLPANACILFSAFSLNYGERQTIQAPEHIINEAFAFFVRHSADWIFAIFGVIERPTRFTQ